MSEQIVLVEIEGYNKATGLAETLRFCDGLAYRTRPAEVPANALYRPFLLDPGWCRVDIYTGPGKYGQITPGECVLDDSSGTLGGKLIGYAFDGRSIVVRIGERGAPYPAGYVTVINGTLAGQPSFDWNKITFHPADLTAAQQKTLQTTRFAGNNVLPNGVEGLDDIKSKVKPMVLALASNMSPVLCNTSKLIYQVSVPVGAAAHAISAVRDGGLPLTAGSAYASLADMQATAPSSGQYRVFSTVAGGCYIRLGASPARGITCDVAYGTAADRTHAQTWRRVLLYAGVPVGSISAADVAALDAALPAEIEFALFDESTAAAALSTIANSAAAAWYGDQTGVYRIAQWTPASGLPLATLTALRTETMDISDPIGNGDVAPAYLVNLSYGRNWTKQSDADLGGDKTSSTDPVRAPGGRAGLAARAWLAEEYRIAPATDATVQTAYKSAVKLELTSLISSAVPAQAFADSQLAAYKVARNLTTLSMWLSPAQINAVRAGAVVSLKMDRWGYNNGKLARVAGVLIDRQTRKTELTLWG
ncbi:hypothetical protein [Duganella sp. OV458]|uniref:hypothetical protein n=1 Tax=Duganella sp. OV458 TaxID=1855290 RepID=UPI0008836A24|nr:hypothetical protein [Duganella sp. OV458]SDH65956.1 hypothetical protein SAMN05216320_1202 [Duganella sp. OV458]